MISITPLYAGLIALLYIHLSIRVITIRRGDKISLGDGGRDDMAFRVRAHANLAEYAPFGLILLGMIEIQGAPIWAVHILGLMLLVGRLLHAWAFQQSPQNLSARVNGMLLTLLMIIGAAVANIGYALL